MDEASEHAEFASGEPPSIPKVEMQKAGWRKRTSIHQLKRASMEALGMSAKKLDMIAAAGKVTPRTGMIQLKAVLNELPKAPDVQQRLEREAKIKSRQTELRLNLEELLNTEANYLQDLRFTVKEFARPLEGVMDRETHFDVFSNIIQLEMLHAQLETDLQVARNAVREGATAMLATLVAKAFTPLVPAFMMYATYCGKFTDAPARLAESVKSSAKVAELVARGPRLFNTALEALLFRPVQRMCAYPLFLREALKHCDPEGDAANYAAFQACFDAISTTIKAVNENVRLQETCARTRRVLLEEVRGVAHLIEPRRKLELEAHVRMRRTDVRFGSFGGIGRRKVSVKWFAFTDCLLVCKKLRASADDAPRFRLLALMPLDEIDVAVNAVSSHDPADPPPMPEGSSRGGEASTAPAKAKRRWVRATRFVLAEERKNAILRAGLASANAETAARNEEAGESGGAGGGGKGGGAGGGGKGGAAGGGAAPDGVAAAAELLDTIITSGRQSTQFVSVTKAAWNNLLTVAEGQITGDSASWLPDDADDIFGARDRDAIHVVQHGRGGGVYMAWAASESEGRRLVEQLLKLQSSLEEGASSLRERIRAARARRAKTKQRGSRAQLPAAAAAEGQHSGGKAGPREDEDPGSPPRFGPESMV